MDNMAVISVQEQRQLQLLNNGLITADKFINKNYLINISDQQIVPLDEYEKSTNVIRLFQIIKLVYDKTENKIGITETNINLVAPTGVVTANGVKDYADGEKAILSMSGDTQVGKIAVGADEKVATINGLILNNNNNSISNVKILGRLLDKKFL